MRCTYFQAAACAAGRAHRLESQGTTVVFGHDDQQWQELKKGAQFYD